MKRLIVMSVCLSLITLPLMAGEDPLNLGGITNLVKTEAEKEIAPVVDMFANGVNTGIYAPLSGKIVAVGVQCNYVPVKKEGLLTDVTISGVPILFLYGGIRVPGIGINLFARGGLLPVWGETIKYYGIGGGWEPDLIPMISTKLIIAYHAIKDFPLLSANSIGGNIIASFTKIPFVKPFMTLGFNRTTIDTEVSASDETAKFSVSSSEFQMTIGAKLFMFTLEFGIVPANTISVSAGFSF